MDIDHFGAAHPSRREFLRRAAAAGLIAVPATGALAACATSGGGGASTPKPKKGRTSGKNPLGVDAGLPLEVAAFNGGYQFQYNVDDGDTYKKSFPRAKVDVKGLQQLGQKLQPRFVSGNPPDVIDNSGAGNLDLATLIAHDQIADLTDLFDAPSYDDPDKKVKETLRPGVIESGEFDGKPYVMNYVYTVWGIWYSSSLFEQKGWEYPKTWDDMMTLCGKIKKTNMAPWTFQGKYPSYILNPILSSAAKMGGLDVLKNIDNLEPGAWSQDAVKAAATAYHELVAKGYVLRGTPGLTHIQSQTKWTQGQAAFIPCGTWLENEAKATTPKNFDMVIQPTPSLNSNDKLPFTAAWESAGEGFVVPAQAKNVQGGKEYLRIMLSNAGSTDFSKLVHGLTSNAGYAEKLKVSSALDSSVTMSKAAGSNYFSWQFGGWYAKMETNVENATGSMMAGEITPGEWSKRCQKAADDTKKDSSIKKYHR